MPTRALVVLLLIPLLLVWFALSRMLSACLSCRAYPLRWSVRLAELEWDDLAWTVQLSVNIRDPTLHSSLPELLAQFGVYVHLWP